MTPRMIILEQVKDIAAQHRVSFSELMGHRRFKPVIPARHHAFYHVWRTQGWPLAQVARFFGCDHTTVAYGIARHMDVNGIPARPGDWMVDWRNRRLARRDAPPADMRQAA